MSNEVKTCFECENYVKHNAYVLRKIWILDVHIAIVRQCTKYCKQLSKSVFKQKVFGPFIICPETRCGLSILRMKELLCRTVPG